MDWKTVLILVLASLLVSAKWWLPELSRWDIRAIWGDKAYSLAVTKSESGPSQAKLVSSQVSFRSYRVAVINDSKTVKEDEVKAAVSALQTQIHEHFAPIWGTDAELTLVSKNSAPPPASWQVVIRDESAYDAPSWHWLTSEGLPLAEVFVKKARELNLPWTLAASHELLEMLANPVTKLAYFREGADIRKGILFNLQVCDPCRSTEFAYNINGTLVSDFVFPAWFESVAKPEAGKFDYGNHIKAPFQILPGGKAYIFEVRSGSNWHYVSKLPRWFQAADGLTEA